MPKASTPSFSERAVLLYRGHEDWMIHGISHHRPFIITGTLKDDPVEVIQQNNNLYWDGAKVIDCQSIPDKEYVPFVLYGAHFDPNLRSGHIHRFHQLDPVPFSPAVDPPPRSMDVVALDIHVELHKTLSHVRMGVVNEGAILWD